MVCSSAGVHCLHSSWGRSAGSSELKLSSLLLQLQLQPESGRLHSVRQLPLLAILHRVPLSC